MFIQTSTSIDDGVQTKLDDILYSNDKLHNGWVGVGVIVLVGVTVFVGVGVLVGVSVTVGVGVLVGVSVGVWVLVDVIVGVGVWVGVWVGVGVGQVKQVIKFVITKFGLEVGRLTLAINILL